MAEPATLVDFYRVLRVPHDVDLEGIRTAYSRLASEYAHRLKSDETCRKDLEQLNEAYNVLADPQLRRDYDRSYFAEEYAAVEDTRKRQLARWRISQWSAIGLLAAIVAIQMVAIVLITVSSREAIADQVGAAAGTVTAAASWAWDQVSAFNDSLGNPIGWFGDIAKSLRRAG
jgi:curved DNA-binding protein CbpA